MCARDVSIAFRVILSASRLIAAAQGLRLAGAASGDG